MQITPAWEISFAAASALLARSPSLSLSFETRTSLGAVHYGDFMSDSTFSHSPLICVKNGSSISIQARAYERYAPSLQGQGVRPSQTHFTSPATQSPERWSLSPAQAKASVSASSWSSSSPSKVCDRSPYPAHIPKPDLLLPRANFSRPFCNLDVPPHPSPLPRPWPASFKRRPSPPSRWRAPVTRASPPCPARTYYLPLPSPSSSLLPFVYRFWKRPC